MKGKKQPETTPGFRLWLEMAPGPNSLYALSTMLYSPTYSLFPGLLLIRGRGELNFAGRSVRSCTNTKVKGNQKAAMWQPYKPKSLDMKGASPLPPCLQE